MSRSGMLVVGVTGRIGSGKSALCAILAERHGCPVIDADALGHEALSDPEIRRALLGRFGEGILGRDRQIDRGRLGAIVFEDPQALRDLNGMVHPWIVARARARLDALRASGSVGIVLVDAALLLDWTDEVECDRVVLVRSPEALSIARLVDRGMEERQARRRLAAQASEEELARGADWIVENAGDLAKLEREAERLWKAIRLRKGGKRP